MPSNSEEVRIFLSPGVRGVLADNATDLEALLRSHGHEVQTRLAADPDAKEGEKDVALILVASAAVIAAATPLLTRLLETLGNRPVVVTRKVPHQVRGKNGKLRTKWVEETEVKVPAKPKVKQETQITAPGFKISLKSETS